jgi:hypothetical protein
MTKKITIIFGAGASYALKEIDDNFKKEKNLNPPLTKDLFDSRFSKSIMDWTKLSIEHQSIQNWLKNNDYDLEKYIQELNNNIKLKNEVRYYLKKLLTYISNNYLSKKEISYFYKFIQRLNNLEDCNSAIINLNYDLFLDFAYNDLILEKQPNDINDYWYNAKIKHFKPHGSVNWVRVEKKNKLDEKFKDHNPQENFKAKPDHKIYLETELNGDEIDQYNQHAVIGLPIEEEKEIIYTEMEKVIKQSTKNSDLIVIIGWSGKDQDIINVIKDASNENKKTRIIICSPNNPKTTLDNLNLEKVNLNNKITKKVCFSEIATNDKTFAEIFS